MIWEELCKILINGNDVTDRFAPRMKSLSVSLPSNKSAASAQMTLHDNEGRLFLPRDRDPVLISIRGNEVFRGYAAVPTHTGGKGAGRELSISASSIDQGGKIKEPALRSMDDADFASVAEAWGKKAGVNVQVTGEMASIKREYWLQQHESFTAWGQRMARELGASFQVHGDRAFFADLNAGVSVTGQPLTDISAIWGENLLNWSLSPIQPRPKFKNLERRYFDVDKGEEVVEAAEEAAEGVEAVLRHHVPSAGKEHAQQSSAADAKASSRNSGGGSVSILGNEACQPEANCLVQGTRPGIDGTYRIDSVDHQISKGGFVTNLNLKEPKGGAGVDPR